MRYSNLKTIIPLLLLLASCSHEHEEVAKKISETATRWVPDKREGVFDISSRSVKARTYVLTGETNSIEAKEELINLLNQKGFQIQDSIRILPYDVPYKWGLATLSVVSLRTEPSHSVEMSNQALMGTPVKILKKDGGWLYVQTPDKYLAWCEEDALVGVNDSELNSWRKTERVIVTKTQDYITDPTGVIHVSDVVAGCILQKLNEHKGKVTVLLPDNRTGEINAESVVDFDAWRSKAQADSATLVETALSMLGTPYLWGASSTKMLDCSGFTKTIYFLNGIILARDASLQALHGTKLELDYQKYQPGDLLFFGKPEHITHVSMYMGNLEYIHAAGRVKINSLSKNSKSYSEHRANSLQTACRIIDAEATDGITPVKEHPWY